MIKTNHHRILSRFFHVSASFRIGQMAFGQNNKSFSSIFVLSDDGERPKVGKLLVDVVLVVLVRPQADHPRLRRLGGHKMSEQPGGLAVVLNLG